MSEDIRLNKIGEHSEPKLPRNVYAIKVGDRIILVEKRFGCKHLMPYKKP